jgi:hypothetical protein
MVGILGSQCNRKNGVGQKLFFLRQMCFISVKVREGKGLTEWNGAILISNSTYIAADRLTHAVTRI